MLRLNVQSTACVSCATRPCCWPFWQPWHLPINLGTAPIDVCRPPAASIQHQSSRPCCCLQAPTASPLLEGRWRLLFTTRPGTASPIQRTFTGVDSFTVYQEILFSSPDGPRVNNIVDFGPKVGFLKASRGGLRHLPHKAEQQTVSACCWLWHPAPQLPSQAAAAPAVDAGCMLL